MVCESLWISGIEDYPQFYPDDPQFVDLDVSGVDRERFRQKCGKLDHLGRKGSWGKTAPRSAVIHDFRGVKDIRPHAAKILDIL